MPRQDLSRILSRFFLAVVLSEIGLLEIASGLMFIEGVIVVPDYSSKFVLGAIGIMGIMGGIIFIIGSGRALHWRPQSQAELSKIAERKSFD